MYQYTYHVYIYIYIHIWIYWLHTYRHYMYVQHMCCTVNPTDHLNWRFLSHLPYLPKAVWLTGWWRECLGPRDSKLVLSCISKYSKAWTSADNSWIFLAPGAPRMLLVVVYPTRSFYNQKVVNAQVLKQQYDWYIKPCINEATRRTQGLGIQA